jgi:hypothetical protein
MEFCKWLPGLEFETWESTNSMELLHPVKDLERRKFIATACRHFWQRSELEIFSFRAFSLHVP